MQFFRRHIKFIIIPMLLVGMVLFVFLYYSSSKDHPQQEIDNLVPASEGVAQVVHKIKGVVVKYGSNPHGDLDKILIAVSNGQIWMHFHPHAASRVLQSTSPQSIVSVEYTEIVHEKGKKDYELKTITDHRNHIIDLSAIPPPSPNTGKDVVVSGSQFSIKKNEEGRAIGFVLEGMLVILPPHIADNLMPMILGAKRITIKGQQRSDQDGFVNVDGKVLRPSSITIDSLTYLIQ